MNLPPALEFSSTPTVPAKNDGLLADIASVLVRLDGYLAHVRSAEGASIGKNAVIHLFWPASRLLAAICLAISIPTRYGWKGSCEQ